jgi:hypothetical protein
MKIGIVGIETEAEKLLLGGFPKFYEAIGLNTGNLLFSVAVREQLNGQVEWVGFHFDPESVNKTYDALVIPAANWINEHSDWSWFIDLLNRISIPAVTIGIGLQSQSEVLSDLRVSQSSLNLVRALSRKSKWISCRGDFTRDWLVSVGVKNVVTTGCPSIYIKEYSHSSGINANSSPDPAVVIQGTRYWISRSFVNSSGPNRNLYAVAGAFNLPMIFQSEPEEIQYLLFEESRENQENKRRLDVLAELYGLVSGKSVASYLNSMGKVFLNLNEWSSFINNNIGVIGTRLHGSIIALNNSKPALLIAHDSRTSEMARFSRIPVLDEKALLKCTEAELRKRLMDVDVSEYGQRRVQGARIYKQFLAECGLQPNCSAIVGE